MYIFYIRIAVKYLLRKDFKFCVFTCKFYETITLWKCILRLWEKNHFEIFGWYRFHRWDQNIFISYSYEHYQLNGLAIINIDLYKVILFRVLYLFLLETLTTLYDLTLNVFLNNQIFHVVLSWNVWSCCPRNILY